MFSYETKHASLIVAGGAHFLQPGLSYVLIRCGIPFPTTLRSLPPLMRQIFSVLMLTTTLTVVGSGLLVVTFSNELALGGRVSSTISGALSLFWLVRTLAQVVYGVSGAWAVRPSRV